MRRIVIKASLLIMASVFYGLIASSCAAPAAVDEPVHIQMLQADQAALQERLRLLQEEKETDLQQIAEKRKVLNRTEDAAPWLVDGGAHPYLAIHADYLRRAVNSFLPAGLSREDFAFSFQESIIDRSREEIRISINFQVRSHKLSSVGGGTSSGRLTGIIKPDLDRESGWVQLVFVPQSFQIEGVYGRTEAEIRNTIALDWFNGLIPPLPAPMLPGYDPGKAGDRNNPVQIEFMTDKYLVLFERIIIPFKFTSEE